MKILVKIIRHGKCYAFKVDAPALNKETMATRRDLSIVVGNDGEGYMIKGMEAWRIFAIQYFKIMEIPASAFEII